MFVAMASRPAGASTASKSVPSEGTNVHFLQQCAQDCNFAPAIAILAGLGHWVRKNVMVPVLAPEQPDAAVQNFVPAAAGAMAC